MRWIKEEDTICGIQGICYPQIRHPRTQLILKESAVATMSVNQCYCDIKSNFQGVDDTLWLLFLN